MPNNNMLSGSIPDTDLSKQILDQLFGSGWNLIGSGGVFNDSSSLLLEIFRTFNGIAMFVGSVLLGWVMMQGIIGTAHEGQFLGKRMHSVWAPVRAGVSISMLAPVFKGFCALQLICLLCINQSVILANNIWSVSLDFMGKNHGMVSKIDVPPELNENTQRIALGILESLSISYYQEYFREKAMPSERYTTKWIGSSTGEGHWQIQFLAPLKESGFSFKGIDDSDMGSITIPTHDQSSDIAQARIDGILQMVENLKPLALSIILNCHPGYEDVSLPKSSLQTAITNYNTKIAAHIGEMVADGNEEYESNLKEFVESAKETGWFFAGSYYWNISGFADQVHKIARNFPIYNEGDRKLLTEMSDSDLNTVLGSVTIISDQIKRSMDIAEETMPGDTGITKQINMLTRKVFGSWTIDWLTGYLMKGDPIANLSNLGHVINKTAWAGVGSAVALKAAAAGFGEAGGWWKKAADGVTGGWIGVAQKAIEAGLGLFLPFFVMCLLPLFGLGLSLAFYLPTLPFITWIVAFVSWLLLVLETLFAAPLWAVAHAMPEGEGIAGQHGRTGYMLLLAVLVRPPLMIAGFMCAVILMPVVGKFVGVAFMIFSRSMAGNHVTGLTTVIAMMFIVGFLYVLLAHKIFKLVTHLPDSVTKWVGQQVQNLGEEGDEARTRNMFAGAVGKVEGTASTAMRTGGKDRKNSADPGDKMGKGEDAKGKESQHAPEDLE